jgi:dTDP-4-amino-4,6-dideoxygalactose transaminase
MHLSFNDVSAHAQKNQKQLLSRYKKVLQSGIFLCGKENKKLTRSLQHILGGYITLVASGHDALFLSLRALHLCPNDEVIVPANAYPTAFPVALSGATLVLCDVDQNGQLSPAALQKRITNHTKVVIMVHLYGLVGDLTAIQATCKKYSLILIEDCAQAFGSEFRKKPVGTFGDIGCFSFYPSKNLGSLGDGGAIRTNNKKIFMYINQAVSYGEKIRYQSTFVSSHSRVPELIAAGLNVYFRSFQHHTNRRKKIYTLYAQSLQNLLVHSHPDSNPNPHLAVIRIQNRQKLISHLSSLDIQTMIHYPTPIHLVPAFKYLGYHTGDFPEAEKLSQTILSIPLGSFMTKKQVWYIVDTIQNFYGRT